MLGTCEKKKDHIYKVEVFKPEGLLVALGNGKKR
jgi:hypothetical protein